MTNYDHIFLIIEDFTDDTAIEKADLLAHCYGARLSIGCFLPQVSHVLKEAHNVEKSFQELLQAQLQIVGKRHKIPSTDQWVLSPEKTDLVCFLREKAVDLLVLGKSNDAILLRSQIANKILTHYACNIQFVNSQARIVRC